MIDLDNVLVMKVLFISTHIPFLEHDDSIHPGIY